MRATTLLALLPLAVSAFEFNVLLDETIRAYEQSRLRSGNTEPDESCGKVLMERLKDAPTPPQELQDAMSSGSLIGGCPITAVSSVQPALETFSSTINEWAKEVVSDLHASKSCGFTMEEAPQPTAGCELVFLDDEEMEKAIVEDKKKREEMMKAYEEKLKKMREEAKAEAEEGDKEDKEDAEEVKEAKEDEENKEKAEEKAEEDGVVLDDEELIDILDDVDDMGIKNDDKGDKTVKDEL